MPIRRLLSLVLIAWSMMIEAPAQAWPSKPVKLIASLGAGTSVDLVCRMIGERLSRALGQPFVVENIVGAGGMAGAQAAARAVPDGYTVYLAPASALTSNLYLYKSLPYDPRRDFIAVAMIVDSGPFIVSVHPDIPATNLAGLIALAKAQPGKFSYAVDVSSGYGMIVGQWLVKAAGVQIEEVPYKASAQAMQDAMGGRVQIVVSSVAAADPFARSGKLRRLAISSRKRFPGLESLPTIAETLPGVQLEGWFMLVVPSGTPMPIVERLNREIDVILKEGEVPAKMLAVGLASSPGAESPHAQAAFVRGEQERWAGIVKELGLQAQ